MNTCESDKVLGGRFVAVCHDDVVLENVFGLVQQSARRSQAFPSAVHEATALNFFAVTSRRHEDGLTPSQNVKFKFNFNTESAPPRLRGGHGRAPILVDGRELLALRGSCLLMSGRLEDGLEVHPVALDLRGRRIHWSVRRGINDDGVDGGVTLERRIFIAAAFRRLPRGSNSTKRTAPDGRERMKAQHFKPLVQHLANDEQFVIPGLDALLEGPLERRELHGLRDIVSHPHESALSRVRRVRRPRSQRTPARACVIVTCSSRMACISSTPLSTPVPVSR